MLYGLTIAGALCAVAGIVVAIVNVDNTNKKFKIPNPSSLDDVTEELDESFGQDVTD